MKGLALRLSVLMKNLRHLDPSAIKESQNTLAEAIKVVRWTEEMPAAGIVVGDGDYPHIEWIMGHVPRRGMRVFLSPPRPTPAGKRWEGEPDAL